MSNIALLLLSPRITSAITSYILSTIYFLNPEDLVNLPKINHATDQVQTKQLRRQFKQINHYSNPTPKCLLTYSDPNLSLNYLNCLNINPGKMSRSGLNDPFLEFRKVPAWY